jgi:hypothetical protein
MSLGRDFHHVIAQPVIKEYEKHVNRYIDQTIRQHLHHKAAQVELRTMQMTAHRHKVKQTRTLGHCDPHIWVITLQWLSEL